MKCSGRKRQGSYSVLNLNILNCHFVNFRYTVSNNSLTSVVMSIVSEGARCYVHCTKRLIGIDVCALIYIYIYIYIYRVSQEESTVFWEVIVSVILSKKLYKNVCSIPNGFRDRAI
jgi:hypothetical protein